MNVGVDFLKKSEPANFAEPVVREWSLIAKTGESSG